MKPAKDQDVDGPGKPVARMLPLAKPELQDPFQPIQGPIETKITFAAGQRRQAFRHNVGEARQAQHIHDEEQNLT